LLEVYTDGGCRVGTGKGAATFLVVDGGCLQYIHSFPLIKNGLTNNQAEYMAVVMAIMNVSRKCTLFSDSEIVVKQMNGEYAVKDAVLKEIYSTAKEIVKNAGMTVTFKNVPRTNKYIGICDKMNKQMMELI